MLDDGGRARHPFASKRASGRPLQPSKFSVNGENRPLLTWRRESEAVGCVSFRIPRQH